MTISSQQKKLMALLQARLVDSVEADLGAIESCDHRERLQLLKSLEVNAAVMSDLATSIGLKGLARACTLIKNNFQLLSVGGEGPEAEVAALVKSWAVPLSAYFHCIGHSVEEDGSVDVVVDFLSDPSWPSPLSLVEEEDLKEVFAEPYFLEQDHALTSDVEITEQMGSLHVTVDVDNEMFSGFLSELSCQVEAFDFAVEQFLITEDPVQLRVAQRIVHTIKGAAKFVGIQGISNLAHYIEDALNAAAHSGKVQAKLAPVLQSAADCLSSIEEYLSDCGPKPENLVSVMQAIRDCCGEHYSKVMSSTVRIDTSGLYKGAPHKVFHLENLIAFNDPGLNRNPPMFTPDLVGYGSPKETIPKDDNTISADVVHLSPKMYQSDMRVPDVEPALKDLEGGVSVVSDRLAGLKETALVQLSGRQYHEITDFIQMSQKCNLRALDQLSALIANAEEGDQSGVSVADISSIRHDLFEQSKHGAAVQSLLRDMVISVPATTTLTVDDHCNDHQAPIEDRKTISKDVLIVNVGSRKVCIPVDSVKRILYVEKNCLSETEDGCYYRSPNSEELLMAVKLDEMLFPNDQVSAQSLYGAMLIVDSEGVEPFGVLVESIKTRQTQTIRPAVDDQKSQRRLLGLALLDGEDVPVVDMKAISLVAS